MYGRGTVGGAELDTWNQWEAWQRIDTMEPGRAILSVAVSLTSVGENESEEGMQLTINPTCEQKPKPHTISATCNNLFLVLLLYFSTPTLVFACKLLLPSSLYTPLLLAN